MNKLLSTKGPVFAPESLMVEKAHGSCKNTPQKDLEYGCAFKTMDKIGCYNRHYAEYRGYAFDSPRTYMKTLESNAASGNQMAYYDPVDGKPLFVAPRGRSYESFINESRKHGWPSFRDEEVVW